MSELSSHIGVISRHRPGVHADRPGLRERKKQQTRTRIIDVALKLCDEQGFDATTVEQIADAADVSPRTVNRYFDSKEAIVIAPIEGWGQALADALRAQPVTGDEMEALLAAFLAVVDQIIESDAPVPFRWFQQMQRISRDSVAVRALSMESADTKTRAMTEVLAERLQLPEDHLTVRLIAATWHGIVRVGMECEFDSDSEFPDCTTAMTARSLADNVLAAFHEFRRVCCGSTVASPTSETAASAR
ncbi:TetR family transcriptional regulator [Nocardia sp. CDC153]|uniref:TetR/AcrR family transcriptional regulator n=1 Tax=Nocardia sp. CDC153 TaxID=3112167 RepID=UPI002DBD1F90|nr:TetR family transcriptional regulator [Nocardia sp. CDC153]MEC3954883.1 TetR family transcriptional regulator [Nocardia sp. CDC153]